MDFLPLIISGVVAIIVSTIAAVVSRRGNKESNDTTAFDTVTNKLFRMNEDLTKIKEDLTARLEALDKKVSDLETAGKAKDVKISHLETEVAESREATARIARYLGKVLKLWPQGTPMPAPDEPLDWEKYL